MPTDNTIHMKFVIAAALILCGLLVCSIVLGLSVERGGISAPTNTASHFPEVSIEAKAAYVLDSFTGEVLFAKEEDKRLPLASLTKLMAALVA